MSVLLLFIYHYYHYYYYYHYNSCLTRLTSGYFRQPVPYKIVKCKLICNKGMNKVVVVVVVTLRLLKGF